MCLLKETSALSVTCDVEGEEEDEGEYCRVFQEQCCPEGRQTRSHPLHRPEKTAVWHRLCLQRVSFRGEGVCKDPEERCPSHQRWNGNLGVGGRQPGSPTEEQTQGGPSALTSWQMRVMNDGALRSKAPCGQGTPKKSRSKGGGISETQSARLRVVSRTERL